MTLLRPTRRELIAAAPLLLGAAALPARAFGAADPQALNFLVVGDWGRDGKKGQQAVADRMAITAQEVGSRFVVSTGDNFYFRGVSSATDRQWDTSFQNIYAASSLQTPWYPVLGNHDYGGNVQAQLDRRKLFPRWQMRGRRYAIGADDLKRDDVALFFIDTVAWLGKESFPFKWLGSDIAPDDQRKQRDWLVEQLRASRARHKFVFGHHGIYSIGPHGGTMRMKELDDVLRRFGVTAYVHGHDHCLYHISRAGLHYICSGAGSEVLHHYTGGEESGCVLPVFCDTATRDDVFPFWHYYLEASGFATFQAGPGGAAFQFVDTHGTVVHDRALA
jgi:tartrate-resistant acid phosphatase type 5